MANLPTNTPETPSEATGALGVLAAGDLTARTGTAARPAITNQAVLEDMQKLFEQTQARNNYWLQDLADAQAWWSGGAAGPGVGLALRAQTRAQQAKQLEDLQAQISQGKVNLAQLGEANASMGEPQAGVSTSAPMTGGSQATPTGGYTIRGVQVPETVYRSYQAYLRQGMLTKANDVFEKYAQESAKGEINFATNPAAYKQDDYYDEKSGQITGKNPMQIRGLSSPVKPVPSLNVPHPDELLSGTSLNKPTSTQPVTGGQDVYRFENLSDGAKQRLNDYARTQLGLQGDTMNRADASELFNKMPMAQRKAAFTQANETPVVSQQPSSVTTTTEPTGATAPTTVPSYSEAKAIAAGKKSFTEKAGAKAGEATGTRQGDFETSAVEANRDLQNANVMLNILDKTPEAVGLGYKNRALGATIELGKLLTGKDIEPLARRTNLSPEAIEAGNKFDALAETNNLKFRRAVMKGTGQVSDFETKLTERASGLSKDNSVEANRFFATIAAENYRTLNKLGEDWQKFQKRNPGATFDQFEQSAEWKQAQSERENRLKQYFPEIETGGLGFGSRAPSKGAQPSELEGWRKRYGTKRD